MFYIYILHSPGHDKYYVGQTQNLTSRLASHNELSENSYTSKYRPWELRLAIPVATRSLAVRIEKYIKKRKSRSYVEELIVDEQTVDRLLAKFDS